LNTLDGFPYSTLQEETVLWIIEMRGSMKDCSHRELF
jgi:hypothetical protein